MAANLVFPRSGLAHLQGGFLGTFQRGIGDLSRRCEDLRDLIYLEPGVLGGIAYWDHGSVIIGQACIING
jgi:hypothetical protein